MIVFRSRFFWKLYASYATAVLATAAIIGIFVHREMKSSLVAEAEKSLKHEAVLLGPFAARCFRAAEAEVGQDQVIVLGRKTGIRITLIRPDGTVIADSEGNPETMDNHGRRPEVRDAFARSFGVSRRYSRTVKYSMLNVARAVSDENGVAGVVRVAVPLRAVEDRLRSMRAAIGLGTGIGVVAALVLGVLAGKNIAAPISEMTEVAEAFRNGQYDRRVRAAPKDEVGVLGDALNRLGAEVRSQIGRLSQQEAQLRAVIAGMAEGVIAVDDEERILLCNRAACELFQLADGCPSGKRLWEIVRFGELSKLLSQARVAGQVRGEVVWRQGDCERILDARISRFGHEGTHGLVLVLNDVSDLRRLERIRRDFVANVSHEIRTPLTSIKGYVETLLDGALRDEENNVRFLKKIDDHARRLTNLVQDLLSLARVESGKGVGAVRRTDWRPIVATAVRRHELAIKRKGLALTTELDDGPAAVLGDPEAMTQIVDNLLDNAIKYTPAPGRISVRVEKKGSFGCLTVEDSGVGIPRKDLDRIFERFYRVDKARSRELGGTGLGLSIVKHLVQAMKGEVRVESRLGKGSRFTVLLPLVS